MRSTLQPCLPTAAKVVPGRPGWLHEIKYDGYRLVVVRDGAQVRLLAFVARWPSLARQPSVTTLPGNRAPDKRKSTRRIDVTVSLIMAIGAAPSAQRVFDVASLIG